MTFGAIRRAAIVVAEELTVLAREAIADLRAQSLATSF
jgi:hypothetical protein